MNMGKGGGGIAFGAAPAARDESFRSGGDVHLGPGNF
jgi:hypothetical protein